MFWFFLVIRSDGFRGRRGINGWDGRLRDADLNDRRRASQESLAQRESRTGDSSVRDLFDSKNQRPDPVNGISYSQP